MINEDTIRLILEMTGSRSIEEVTRKLQEQKSATEELAESYNVLEREYEVVQQKVSNRTKEASEERARSAAIVNKIVDEEIDAMRRAQQQADQTAKGKEALGRSVLQTSYIVQDFTSVLAGGGGLSRALASVQNNIPLLLTGLGAGAGLAGTVSLVSVALGGAIPLLDAFTGKQTESAKATKELADQMERIAKLKTPEQEKQQKTIEEFIKEQPGGVVLQGIQQALQQRARPQAQRAVRESIEQFGVVQETEEQMMERWAPQIAKDAATILKGATENDQDLGTLLQLAGETPGAFPKNFAPQLKRFSDFQKKRSRKGEITQSMHEYGAEVYGDLLLAEYEAENYDRRAKRAANMFGTDALIDELQFGYQEGPYDRGRPPLPMSGFGTGIRAAAARQQRGMGYDDAAIDAARAAGAATNRFGGLPPARARQQANDPALGRRMAPNSIDAQGNPVFDPRVDALIGEVEKLQGITERSHKYISRDVERLNRIRAKNKHLEQQSQQLNQTTLDRGR